RRPHQVVLEARVAVFTAGPMKFALISRFPLASGPQGVVLEFVLQPGECTTFILQQLENGHNEALLEARLTGEALLTETLQYWRRWLAQCRYTRARRWVLCRQ